VTATAPAAAPTPVAPLSRNRAFRLLWLGEGVSVLGNATSFVLLPLLAVAAFDAGPGWMGALATAAWLPWLLIGLPAGAWVDGLPARAVMIAADLVSAVAYASVPVAWWLDVLTLAQLLLVSLVGGAATVFFRTAYSAFLPQVVEPEHLESANGRLFGTESAMQVAGPGVGGLLAQWFGAAFGILLDAASFVFSAACLWRIRTLADGPAITAPTSSLRSRIGEGVAFVRRDRYLPWLTGVGGLANLGHTGLGALLVLFLVRDLGLDPSGVGLVMAIGSSGGLLGALLATRVSRRIGSGHASTLFMLGAGIPCLLVPFAGRGDGVVLVPVALFLAGMFVVAGNVVRGAWRQRYVPIRLMGRVVTTTQLVNFGTMPVGGLLAGGLGATLGVRTTIAAMAVVVLVSSLIFLLSPLCGLRDLPEPERPVGC
jgi:predicted MFS family arabinose efflux permease